MDDSKIQNEILNFWFGPTPRDHSLPEKRNMWFKKSDQTDAEIRQKFQQWVEKAGHGQLDHWLESPRGALAVVVLLDQFTRNIYRNQAEAFQFDGKALEISLNMIESGRDQQLDFVERTFLYMPLMHAEDRAIQEKSIQVFRQLSEDFSKKYPEEENRIEGNLKFAHQHKKIIDQFGRYPHRNEILGRTSTPEELEFLKSPNSGF